MAKKKELPSEAISNLLSEMFTTDSRGIPIDRIRIKFSQYHEQITIFVDCLQKITKLVSTYEPGAEIITRTFADHYEKFFKFIDSYSDDEIYEKYDEFKKSSICTYCARISGKIARNHIGGKWNCMQNMAIQGLLTLNIFDKVIDDVSAPYDLACYYHSNMAIPVAELKKNRAELTDCLKQLYFAGKKIYSYMSTPDIDVAKIFEAFRGYSTSLRSEIRGANRIFDQINNGGHIFEQNFTKYYKELTKTGSPVGMFTEFITDVVKQPGIHNKELVIEAGTLINTLKKKLKTNIPPSMRCDPKVKSVETVIDTVLEFIAENQELGENECAFDGDDLKKMISELENKFGVS